MRPTRGFNPPRRRQRRQQTPQSQQRTKQEYDQLRSFRKASLRRNRGLLTHL